MDPAILIDRLQNLVCVRNTAIDLFYFNLLKGSFWVIIGDQSSSSAPINHGVPQGSMLCQIVFVCML